MYPFQQTDELSQQNNEDTTRDKDQVNVEAQIWEADNNNVGGAYVNYSRPPLHNNTTTNNRSRFGRGRRRSSLLSPNDITINSSSTSDTIVNNIDDLEDQKKMIHRDIERQRRQEMSQLFASLNSILPPQYTKGRGSTSNSLEKAVYYIKDLEKNVKELSNKRDGLKATSSRLEEGRSSSTSTPWSGGGNVVVLPRQGGLDIEISHVYDDGDGGFLLSNALQVMCEEGLSVASCTSTNVNERLLHQIVCEVSDMACIDVNRLHQRLVDLVG